jgi:hypothetical protein
MNNVGGDDGCCGVMTVEGTFGVDVVRAVAEQYVPTPGIMCCS